MPPDVCIQLGEKIRQLRKKRSWRQIDLAEQSGIHEVHISDLERGAREVGLRHLAALAAAFEMSLSEFLKGVKGR
ncbi:helix-turn-helix domain-containing protein [Acidicapsa ligni]|uniref:helix-turn-helix domain-containing protein n=1 Tax=Acidicapsa ligni TaxID=542300 RepID=UPI0021E0D5C9|nr:helix-turn-helix transcriptional regulator [Acidicapsa ligni]